MKLRSGGEKKNVNLYDGQEIVVVSCPQPFATFLALGYKAFLTVASLPDERPVIRPGTWLAILAPRQRVPLRAAASLWAKTGLVGKPGRLMFPTGSILAVARVEDFVYPPTEGAHGLPLHLEVSIEPGKATTTLLLKDVQALWKPVPMKKPRQPKVAADKPLRKALAAGVRPPDWVV